MSTTMQRLRDKWGVSPWEACAILVCFSLAGASIVFVRGPVLGLILPARAPLWLQIVAYLALMVPLYQLFLLAYGTLLGQFRFFWEKEKKLARLLARLFLRLAGMERRARDRATIERPIGEAWGASEGLDSKEET